MTSLRELQAGFAAALRDRPGAVASEIVSDDLGAASRLQVYRSNSRAMFAGALERTYPVLRRRVGDDYFRQLERGYRERYRSTSGDLHWVGRYFPEFVADLHSGTEYAWLADLAALEWTCECALVAARSRPIGVVALAGIGPDGIADVRLELQPSLHGVSSSFPVLDVWRSNRPGSDGGPVDLASGAQYMLVSCSEAGLELREVEQPVLEFVGTLQRGASLGEALDRSGLTDEAIAPALGLLFDAGLVTGIARTAPGGMP